MNYELWKKIKRQAFCAYNSLFLTHSSPRSGFTLIELVVTVVIIAAVGTVTAVSLSRYRNVKDLERSSDELLAVVQATRKRSITQESGKTWGMRFVNPASGSDYYQVFKGLSYASGSVDKTYYFRRGVSLLNPATSTIDMVFKAIKGTLGESQIISIWTGRGDGYLSDVIVNASSGLSFYRQEQGIVGYWHFDEGTASSSYDSSGNSNTGTLTNGPTWQSGASCKAGKCLSFDGATNSVDISNFTVGGTVTLTAWIKSSTYEGKIPFSLDANAYGSGPNLYFACGTINWNTGDSCTNPFSGSSYPNSGWHHITVVNDGSSSSAKLYVDGQLIGSATYKDTTMSNGLFRIGGWHGGVGVYNLSGSIDEVRVYNRALSTPEILAQYNDLR